MDIALLSGAIIAVWGAWMADRKRYQKAFTAMQNKHDNEVKRVEKRCLKEKMLLVRMIGKGDIGEEQISDLLLSYEEQHQEINTRRIKNPGPITPPGTGFMPNSEGS